MTTPSLAKQRNSNSPRTYAWPPLPPHEFEVLSVTGAIGNGYPKPFLIPWAAKVAAECAVDDHKIIAAMLEKGNERAAIDHIKNARNRTMSEKADRGTIVHAAIEAYIAKKPIDDAALAAKLTDARVPRSMWKSTRGMIEGVIKFLNDEKPTILFSEKTIFSRTHGYAGTADLGAMCGIEKKPGGKKYPVIIDVKSGKAVYDDTAMQLVAYARGDFIGTNDGKELPLLKTKAKIEHGIVVRAMASGTYEKVVFSLSDDVFDLFLHCLAIAGGRQILSQARRPS
jgi:hypothetical protein